MNQLKNAFLRCIYLVEVKDHLTNEVKTMSDELLTDVELAEMLTLKVATVRGWRLKKQGPPYVKVGRMVRYSKDSVTQWLKEREVKNQ